MGEDGASLFLYLHIIAATHYSILAVQYHWRNDAQLYRDYLSFPTYNSIPLFLYKVTWHIFRVDPLMEFFLMPKEDNETSRSDTISSLGGLSDCPYSFQNIWKFDSIAESALTNNRYQVYLEAIFRFLGTLI